MWSSRPNHQRSWQHNANVSEPYEQSASYMHEEFGSTGNKGMSLMALMRLCRTTDVSGPAADQAYTARAVRDSLVDIRSDRHVPPSHCMYNARHTEGGEAAVNVVRPLDRPTRLRRSAMAAVGAHGDLRTGWAAFKDLLELSLRPQRLAGRRPRVQLSASTRSHVAALVTRYRAPWPLFL